jgi:Gram-negative bacterial TonB protein C-terminal/GldM C-terminal domain
MRFIKPFLLLSLICITVIASSQTNTIDSSQDTFTKVDIEASYPGGNPAWKKFLEKNLNPNVPVDHGAPIGVYTVMVQFVIDASGNVSEIKALTNWGYGMENEVLKLMRKSGQWTPAMQNGRPVRAYRKQPVTFAVMEDGFDISPSVLQAGKDNEVTIQVDKLKTEDLRVTISEGTIIPKSDGKFTVRVTKPGRVTIEVYGKKNKKLTTFSLEVKEAGK